jgi:polar amino acid transport system permease protein
LIYTFSFRDVFAQFDTLLDGAVLTLQLSAITMIAGLAIGIVGALARSWGPLPVRLAAASYVEVIRNTPLLIQLFIVFFGLPGLGFRLDATPAAVAALSINLGAYATERRSSAPASRPFTRARSKQGSRWACRDCRSSVTSCCSRR